MGRTASDTALPRLTWSWRIIVKGQSYELDLSNARAFGRLAEEWQGKIVRVTGEDEIRDVPNKFNRDEQFFSRPFGERLADGYDAARVFQQLPKQERGARLNSISAKMIMPDHSGPWTKQ